MATAQTHLACKGGTVQKVAKGGRGAAPPCISWRAHRNVVARVAHQSKKVDEPLRRDAKVRSKLIEPVILVLQRFRWGRRDVSMRIRIVRDGSGVGLRASPAAYLFPGFPDADPRAQELVEVFVRGHDGHLLTDRAQIGHGATTSRPAPAEEERQRARG